MRRQIELPTGNKHIAYGALAELYAPFRSKTRSLADRLRGLSRSSSSPATAGLRVTRLQVARASSCRHNAQPQSGIERAASSSASLTCARAQKSAKGCGRFSSAHLQLPVGGWSLQGIGATGPGWRMLVGVSMINIIGDLFRKESRDLSARSTH